MQIGNSHDKNVFQETNPVLGPPTLVWLPTFSLFLIHFAVWSFGLWLRTSYKHRQTETITDLSFHCLVFCVSLISGFSLSLWLRTNRTKILLLFYLIADALLMSLWHTSSSYIKTASRWCVSASLPSFHHIPPFLSVISNCFALYKTREIILFIFCKWKHVIKQFVMNLIFTNHCCSCLSVVPKRFKCLVYN